ncbi:MAG: Two-component system sensor histidine kinase [uncultured Sphingomonas sp.]|uniref:histidine kinase n=1 Tax=uncultured Sphingomonas sp. TaxID=158754 RepID=A0A6J4TLQ5_9SPHN|nr:MAG: Two-component system sensor histidine kinase [uncultured Sphingomonas sp.]
MSALLSFWSHALAALLFATLLIWQLRVGVRAPAQRLLLAGLLMTTAWAWLGAIQPHGMLTDHAETARNLLWVGLLYSLAAAARDEGYHLHGVRLVYFAVAAVLGLQFIVGLLPLLTPETIQPKILTATSSILRLAATGGALVLVHNLYGQAAPASRTSIRLVMLALALTWVYDLNLYTLAYLNRAATGSLYDARGAFIALTAPLFALGMQQSEGWRVRLSRAATFQSLSLLAICSYFVLMASLATVLEDSSWHWTRALAVLALAGMTVAAIVLLPSPRARGWLKVKAAKHLFEHRYDYRTEWLRFADTLGRSAPDAPPLAERVIKALADIVDAPAGLLLTPEDGGVRVGASWNWATRPPRIGTRGELEALWAELAPDGRVLELDAMRVGAGSDRDRKVAVPQPMLDEERLWTGVPLIHHDKVIGLVLLSAPDLRRGLDWEDFDLLRTAGRQAASSLAEAHGQQALMDAQRFEEFNRRFAFILHDIKNLVSQLSLVTRNAERHADNPEFRADMIATLKGSVGKMNDLLARLAPKAGTSAAPTTGLFPLRPVLSAAVAAKRRGHEVRLLGTTGLMVRGDAAGLEQALGHLIQNAVDASAADQPVTVKVSSGADQVNIEIIDKGCGMDAEFVRARLFQPFASTKQAGFGIGAYEARALLLAMGGELAVESRPGAGTRFTIHLPAAGAMPESLTA